MWDVFHSDRLEVERGLSTAEVRAALARGDLRDDDLVRPAGTTVPWGRLADLPALLEPEPGPETPPPAPEPESESPTIAQPPIGHEQEFDVITDLSDLRAAVRDEVGEPAPPVFPADLDEDEENDEAEALEAVIVDDDEDETAGPASTADYGGDDLDPRLDTASKLALPVSGFRRWDEPEYDPDAEMEDDEDEDDDEAAAEFTLSRSGPEKVEELDLAAMVDVAFQLVLFFLVTATTVLYKSLEVPKPNPESPASSAAQGRSRNLDDLKNDYILVEIDPTGVMKIDREPVPADMNALIERLRSAREKTGRKAMLLSAEYATQHRNAVLAYDAANEIGLGIAIARPTPPPAAVPLRERSRQ